jgi:hypothetical protein
MKRTIFITLGILLTITILSVWVYLFKYGAPENSDEIFARFGVGDNAPESEEVIQTQETSPNTENSTTEAPKRLRQLTTRPVAGAVFMQNNIRFVEQGTGHIYDIDITNGSETLVTSKTIPQTSHAVFSKTGTYVAISYYSGFDTKTIVRSVSSTGIQNDRTILPIGASDISFTNATDTASFVVRGTEGAVGYSYSYGNTGSQQLFALPLRDIHVLWGNPRYVYTTPTASQKGYLYTITNTGISYTTTPGIGLMAVSGPDRTIVTKLKNNEWYSYILEDADEGKKLPLLIIPEKCASGSTTLYCATPTNFSNPTTFPDTWYKGEMSFTDSLWRIDAAGYTFTKLSDFLPESGREIDVFKIGVHPDNTKVWLINKNDNSLWIFDAQSL